MRAVCPTCGSAWDAERAPAPSRPRVVSDEQRLARLLADADVLARWAPYYQGSAMDLARGPRDPGPLLTDAERAEREARREAERARARGLFVRLERLRVASVRAASVVAWLMERGGSERTRGYRVGGEVVAPRLSRLVGEAFATRETRAALRVRATAEQARMLVERHGAELLRDAAQAWEAMRS